MFCLWFLTVQSASGQVSESRNISLSELEQARNHFEEGRYGIAAPLLQMLYVSHLETSKTHSSAQGEEILYMLSFSQLIQDESEGVSNTETYLKLYPANLRSLRLAFEAGNYYYRQNDYGNTLAYYERSDLSQLSNDEVARLKFRQAYSYFQLKRYSSAKPLFNSIRQMPADPNYADAQYYYGFICYTDKEYKQALECFEKVKEHTSYAKVVPYYLSSVYYMLGQKEKAVSVAEASLRKPDLLFRSEINQLLGHAYFERKEYKKAEPLLEAYYKQSQKVTKEQLYELSYTYYSNEKLKEAANGFKQLSEGTDSLSQDAMFLLGDIYLRTGEKASARNAFAYCAGNSSNAKQREVSRFFYAKLSVDLGFQGVAISELNKFIKDYPNSSYTAEAKELLAALLGNTSNYKDALDLLESLDNLSEQTKKLYPRLLFGRAMELLNDQQFNKAEILIDQILSDGYGKEIHPYAHFWKGDLIYRKGNHVLALDHFMKFINSGANTQGQVSISEGHYQAGYCCYHLKKFDQALTHFQKVIDKPSSGASIVQQDAYIRQADCQYQLRKYNAAVDMYQEVLDRSWSQSDYALFQKARITGISKPDQKIGLLLQLQKQFPASSLNTEADMEIAETYMSDEKFADAIPFFKKAVALKSSSLRSYAFFRLATAYYNLNKDDDALQTLQLLLKEYPSCPESADALNLIRAIYIEKGKPQEYEAYLKNTGRSISELEADSLSYQAFQIKVENKDCSGILDQSETYIKRFPAGVHITEVKYQRSVCFQQAKKWKEALEGFEAVAAGNPSPVTESAALYGARIAYFELQDMDRAVQLYNKLLQITSTSDNQLEGLRGKIRCLYKLKRYADAQPVGEELLNFKSAGNDDKAISHLVIGYAYQQKGSFDQAIQSFKQVASINKGEWAAEARYQISKSYFDKKDIVQSEKMAYEVINKSGSYEYWVASTYLLLGDIYLIQKDYFNAKATYQSVADNVTIEELKTEAKKKLDVVIEAEKKNSKIN